MSGLKVVVWDVETGFNLVHSFNLYPNVIYYKNIVKERYMICAAFKELGGDTVYHTSILDDPDRFKEDPTDDYHVVATLYEQLEDVDVLIAHYGDNFDVKFLNTRLLYHGFKPLPTVIQVDTYKIAKAKFLFNSNKLDYLGQYLGLGVKINTSNDLWLKCFNGDKQAVKDMLTYNIEDVELLERVFLLLQPYAPPKWNLSLLEGAVCPTCASHNWHRRGTRYTKTGCFQRYQCKDCGSWFQDVRRDPERVPEFKS